MFTFRSHKLRQFFPAIMVAGALVLGNCALVPQLSAPSGNDESERDSEVERLATEPTEPPPTDIPEPTAVPPTPTPEPLTVLIVVEDALSGRPDFTSSDEIALSLEALDVDFDMWSTLASNAPSLSTLSEYRVVVWAVGDDCCDSPPLESVNAITDYLDQGGNLIIEGGSVAGPWANDPFAQFYLGVLVTGFSPIGDVVVSDAGHPLAAGFPSEPLRLRVSGFVPPDAVDALDADTVFVRGPNSAERDKAAIVTVETGAFKVVFSVVPLQWFSDPDRQRLIENALNWFGTRANLDTNT